MAADITAYSHDNKQTKSSKGEGYIYAMSQASCTGSTFFIAVSTFLTAIAFGDILNLSLKKSTVAFLSHANFSKSTSSYIVKYDFS